MRRWIIFAALLIATACSNQPAPTIPPTTPELITLATIVPLPTLLPTAAIAAPTIAPTITSEPTVTQRATTNAQPPTRLTAPMLLAPQAPTVVQDGNDIKFTYTSVGKLEPNECYLLHVELAVPNLQAGNRGDDFVDIENCGDAGPAGKELSFVLYRGKFTNSPNYGTILAQTLALAPEVKQLNMTWQARVVRNLGRAADGVHYNTTPLSPNSATLEFEFQP